MKPSKLRPLKVLALTGAAIVVAFSLFAGSSKPTGWASVSAVPGDTIARGCGDVGSAFIGTLLIQATLLVLNPADGSFPIPINRVAKGQAATAASASQPFSSKDNIDPPAGFVTPKPGFRVGAILTPGNPPTVGAVTSTVAANVPGAGAEALANISGAVIPGPQPGDILGAKAIIHTECSAGAFVLCITCIASGAAVASTDPFVLDPLSESLPARVDIDIQNLGFQTSAADAQLASASLGLTVETNIPGLEDLLRMDFLASTTDFAVDFASPLVSEAPFAESDFSFDPETGLRFLSSANFSIPFTIPAGIIGTFEEESVGLVLDIGAEGSATVTTACEPPEKPSPSGCAVGGISVGRGIDGLPLETPGSSDSNAAVLVGIASAAAAGAFVLGGAAWYARRRGVR